MHFTDFEALPLLGILRHVPTSALIPLANTVAAAGLRALEITMNTDKAASKIAALCEAAEGRFLVGAGTVVSQSDLRDALAAGAMFIVMPTLDVEIVRACVERGVPVLPGALTPQEVQNADRAGATMVKVFPARVFGPAYFKELLGPFSRLRLLACGGIDEVTLPQYFSAGAAAAAVGASVFRSEWIEAKRFDAIEAALARLLTACGKALPEKPSN